MTTAVQIGHALIALAYFGLAMIFVLWASDVLFRLLPAPPPEKSEANGAKAGFGLFFVGCGIHHLDFLTHISDGSPIDPDALHHAVATAMQVLGATTVVVILLPFLLATAEAEANDADRS